MMHEGLFILKPQRLVFRRWPSIKRLSVTPPSSSPTSLAIPEIRQRTPAGVGGSGGAPETLTDGSAAHN